MGDLGLRKFKFEWHADHVAASMMKLPVAQQKEKSVSHANSLTTSLLSVATKTTTTLEAEVEATHKEANTMVEANLEAVAVAEVTLVAVAEAVAEAVVEAVVEAVAEAKDK